MQSLQAVWEVTVGASVLVVAMIIHGAGMYLVLRRAAHHDLQRVNAAGAPERQLFFGALVTMMLGTHIIEMLLWSAVFTGIGAVAGGRDAFYLAAVTYTTLGYEDVKLPPEWRLLAPLCAMTGVFAFGWTTGTMVSVLTRHLAPAGAPASAVAPAPDHPSAQS